MKIKKMKENLIDKISKNVNFFEKIPKSELHYLIDRSRTISIKKDACFLEAGKVPSKIAFVRSGLMRMYYLENSGKEVTKHFCPEHTLAISFSAFIQRKPSLFYIQALEDSKLLIIDHQLYSELLNRHVFWQVTSRKLAEMVFILKEKREAEFLLDNAQSRYIQFLKDYPNMINRIKQSYISSYLGIAPESLSRIRANLK